MIIIYIPVRILSAITGWNEERIRCIYEDEIDEVCDRIPLEIIPLDYQETYVYDYLYHDQKLDIDLWRLTGPQLEELFRETDLIRKAYFAGRNGEILHSLAEEYNISFRTLTKGWRDYYC